MKISHIALTIVSLMLSSPARILAKETVIANSMQDMPTFMSPQNEDEPITRYIVKYKEGSQEFETRMQAARQDSTRNLRSSATPDKRLLTFGSFLPKDNAEVLYLSSEKEVQEWEEKDDVEYVELGTLRERRNISLILLLPCLSCCIYTKY